MENKYLLTWRALKNKSALHSSLLFIKPSIIQTQERINSSDLKGKKKKKYLSVPGDAVRLSESAALRLHGQETQTVLLAC